VTYTGGFSNEDFHPSQFSFALRESTYVLTV
jgi:hypothetical protein